MRGGRGGGQGEGQSQRQSTHHHLHTTGADIINPCSSGSCAPCGLVVALAGCGSANGVLVPAPPTAGGWTLSWSDEFEGPAGAAVDATRWTFDVGGGGWGNNELESYTDRPKNAHLRGDGTLVIDVLREAHVGPDGIARDYTSARLKTQGRFSQTYGRFEARLKLPRGRGHLARVLDAGHGHHERRLARLRRDRHHGVPGPRAQRRAQHDSRPRILGRGRDRHLR